MKTGNEFVHELEAIINMTDSNEMLKAFEKWDAEYEAYSASSAD